MNNNKDFDFRIKLVVIDEHTLGYIFPEYPDEFHILSKNCESPYRSGDKYVITHENIRLACEQDFENFYTVFDGYNNPARYIYDNK
ncbi:hypothetical protein HYO65_gp089 [Tenacibaculum phage PTm1]|uniref:Uncharacterized protein n=2 Tax=Shirahamavirus PTm1 TaxID=2846435 RepID=A0A5S9ERJ6_9CAUD|nr:hypothetical protein HYO65_gp089 [Tenacibaculum phage PTm1]BBI90481.1 hypothetical protein [Tenacibaculum phage PTm1]BBI90789.1 hypothetical protein [Tenacibaculum phage PTm5]